MVQLRVKYVIKQDMLKNVGTCVYSDVAEHFINLREG